MKRALALLPVLCATLLLRADDFHPVTLPLGASAPEFNLPGVDSRNHSLKDFADARVLVVIFTCDRCPTALIRRISDTVPNHS